MILKKKKAMKFLFPCFFNMKNLFDFFYSNISVVFIGIDPHILIELHITNWIEFRSRKTAIWCEYAYVWQVPFFCSRYGDDNHTLNIERKKIILFGSVGRAQIVYRENFPVCIATVIEKKPVFIFCFVHFKNFFPLHCLPDMIIVVGCRCMYWMYLPHHHHHHHNHYDDKHSMQNITINLF